jgi:hypothetical protein
MACSQPRATVYFNAIMRMPVGVAMLLEYLGVVLTVGMMWGLLATVGLAAHS